MSNYIIIGGAPRSGKTTLARRLNREKGISIISNDFLVSALEGIFPELEVKQGEEYRARTSERIFPFMKAYMWLHSDWGQQPFVMDTTHVMPEQIASGDLKDKYKVIYMAYPRISAEVKLSQIRQYAASTGDWTNGVNDEDLLKTIREMIDFSKEVEAQCVQNNIPFYDTSESFSDVLDDAYTYLCDTIQEETKDRDGVERER